MTCFWLYIRHVLILLLFFAAALRTSLQIPAFEGPDEIAHFGYIADMRRTARLPNPTAYRSNLARHESAQPPMQYVIGWAWSHLAPFDDTWNGDLPYNPWHRTGDDTLGDNANANLFGPGHPATHPTLELSLHWARLVSVMMGVLAVAIALRAAHTLFGPGWALFAGALFAFNPTLIRAFALFGNDASAVLFGTVSVAVLVMLARSPQLGWRQVVGGGALLGFALLTKASLLVFGGGAGLALLLRWQPRRLLALGVTVIVIGFPWYIWHGVAYGDPLGTTPHQNQGWAVAGGRGLAETLVTHGYTFAQVWYLIDPDHINTVPFGYLPYAVPLLVLVLGAVGWGRGWRHIPLAERRTALVLASVVLATAAAYMQWLTQFRAVSGRLMLPPVLGLVLIAVTGLRAGLPPHIKRPVRLAATVGAGFVSVVLMTGLIYPLTYTPWPYPAGSIPHSLQASERRYGDVELVGYDVQPPRLGASNALDVRLCWQSVQGANAQPVPLAFGVQLIDGETVIARRESLPGMGSYTLWQPGHAFCDRFRLHIDDDADVQAGRGYRLAVGLFDPATGASVPDDNGRGPFVGWVASPGAMLEPAAAANAAYHFNGGLHLLDYTLTERNGELRVTTAWGTGNWQSRPLQLFVHVVAADGDLLAQSDAGLGADEYPAALWGQHERTHTQTTTLPLPDGAGDYCVRAGLYPPNSGQRVAVTNAEGQVMPDSVALLACIE